jgi:hypothetical protein
VPEFRQPATLASPALTSHCHTPPSYSCKDDWRAECSSRGESETVMLRISYSQTDTGQRWTLCGHLAGPWVQELRSFWQHTRQTATESRAVIDLSDVTFVDEHGERLLSQMRTAGVEFVAVGVETKHLIENLEGNGERPLRRWVRRSTDEDMPCGSRGSRK